MDRSQLKPLVVTLGIGFTGAGLGTYAGLPAAPLIGASIAVSLALAPSAQSKWRSSESLDQAAIIIDIVQDSR